MQAALDEVDENSSKLERAYRMPQIVKGLLLGSPGPVGSAGIYVLYGKGAPSNNTTDANIGGAQLGSLYIDYQGGALYLKTALPNTWTQK